ncbi:MAG: hypothetical protein IJ043_09685 [Clostridia bacterium]|nr:hypothetical protein [Clostridia bacterium]
MTIQISVTIWTIICFILLMLILHHLLFKPVLGVMDKRRERIENAAAKKAEHQRLAEEYEAALQEQKVAAQAARKKQAKAQVEAIRAESKQAIEEAKDLRLQELDAARAEADAERQRILQALSTHSMELATAFAESLTKE